MHTLDLQAFPELHPAAGFALGSIAYGRNNLKNALADLTQDQLYTKPANFNNSIATLLNHIAATEVSFSHLIQGLPVAEDLAATLLLDQPQRTLPEPVGVGLAELESRLAVSFDHVHAAFKTITNEDLPRLVRRSSKWSYSVQWMISLLPVHQFLHLGHMQMLRKHL